jgi:uncharacterized protein
MPVSTSYPGIYIQELPSQSQTITPSPTSVTVFVGYTHPFETTTYGAPIELFSFTDYERYFGGLYVSTSVDSNVAFAVQQFFLNGGSTAYVVGLQPKVNSTPLGSPTIVPYYAATGTFASSTSAFGMLFSGLQPADGSANGTNSIKVSFSNQQTYQPPASGAPGGYTTADLTISYGSSVEVYRGVSSVSTSPSYIGTVLANSSLVSVAPLSTGGSLGLFPPLYLSNPSPVPALTPQSVTLTYFNYLGAIVPTTPVITGTFAHSNLSFTSNEVGTVTGAVTVTITSLSSSYDGGTGHTGGYLTANSITITDGTTTESYSNVPVANFTTVLGASKLVTVATTGTAAFPPVNPPPGTQITATPQILTLGPNPSTAALTAAFEAGDFTTNPQANGNPAPLQSGSLLDKLAVFNLLVVPGITDFGVLSEAVALAEAKRAFLIMDTPALDTLGNNLSVEDIVQYPAIGTGSLTTIPFSVNAALYYPYLLSPNPLSTVSGATLRLPPSGFVAGIYASTDQSRGVWKAPAGLATVLTNANGVVPEGVMTDMQAGVLNPAAINAIRTFPGQGTVVFGARTVLGATTDTAYQQWRYIPVRRTALFIEQTLYANLGWAVFEPNDTPLWNAIQSSVSRFMLSLFQQGAFQGTTPSQAFLVKCDSSTTTQDDIDNGIVNVLVGFAPLSPAEFVIIQITQLAGQASS